ncbi:Uncharacterized protein YvpB [Halolactibacillus halophilus]|uniref:Uncharacterized protein YvpB n=1 Tax=Halolactibacillus halophilus TaxID=306540 RepID=A0A1I5TDS5_9BACI|nr:C39 family peptidase [Halolactibacillus halophilus]GEM02969.1 hypothetical protein HHA03_25010 [Halolactibacillus halophilus]SFP80586.1 Uncharacterized protein YvpB [Halolactibacillus halophilus]
MKTVLLGVMLILILFIIFLLHRFTRKKHSHMLVKLMVFHLYVYIGLLFFVSYHFFSVLPYHMWTDEVNALFSIEARSATNHTASPRLANFKQPHSNLLHVPLINQFPELPRGCEVTALAMLMQYYDVDTDKLTLAKQVKKDTTPYNVIDNHVHFGNPHNGFVGDMYTFEEPGLGVYYEPLLELANSYDHVTAKNLTGQDFNDLLATVGRHQPVLVITNITFKPLPSEAFTTWQTTDGPITITYKMHAVVITGYDKDRIFFNDPYDGQMKQENKTDFISAWEQMGSQALSLSIND